MSSIGQRFKTLRADAGLSTREFAVTLGISQAFVSQIERDIAKPSPRVMAVAASKLGVNEAWLLSGDGEQYSSSMILHTRHSDPWVRGFLESLVRCWNSGDYTTMFIIDEGFQAVFDERWLTWVNARRPVPSSDELQYITPLNDIFRAADDERLVDVAPRTAAHLTRLISLLAYGKVSDYCDFLKEWWDAATDDEHAWARVELKRRLPMLF